MQSVSKQARAEGSVRVAVCVTTFQRVKLLQRLLDALALLDFKKVREPSLQIFVIDNDANQTARSTCRAASLRWPVRYVCEPRRGIASARNRAIKCAAGSDFLAFIDDDELPVSHWLDELLHTQSQSRADVVAGSLIPAFSDDVPTWVRRGKFFDRPIFATGCAVELCSTGNVLIRAGAFSVVSGFDEQFNLTGGEDTHFFLRVREAGLRMIFAKEAIVYEPISAKRANFAWLIRRGFQVGNCWALCEGSVHPGWRTSVSRVAKELIHIGRGILELMAAPFIGKSHLVRSLQKISAGVGTLAGVAGYRFLPYANVQETPVLREKSMGQTPAEIEMGPLP